MKRKPTQNNKVKQTPLTKEIAVDYLSHPRSGWGQDGLPLDDTPPDEQDERDARIDDGKTDERLGK
jgi:hypothetical protein